MNPGLATIIEKVCILWYFGSPEIDLHIAENACCMDYADTWSSERVHWLLKCQSSHRDTTHSGCEDTVEHNTGVGQSRLQITGIHMRVAEQSKIHWSPATFHNSKWVDHCEVCHGSIDAISILDPAEVKEAYSQIASHYHNVQRHVRSHGRRDTRFGPSAKNNSVRAEWLCQSGCAPSKPSETPRGLINSRPASIPRVALHIALRSPFRCFFSLCPWIHAIAWILTAG